MAIAPRTGTMPVIPAAPAPRPAAPPAPRRAAAPAPTRPSRRNRSATTLTAARRRVTALSAAIDHFAGLDPAAAEAAPALRAPLPLFTKAVLLLEEGAAGLVEIAESPGNKMVVSRMAAAEMQRVANPRHEPIERTRQRVEAEMREKIMGPFGEQFEAQLKPRAEAIAGKLVDAVLGADKAISKLRIRLRRPPVERLSQADRELLPSLRDYYQSMSLSDLEKYIADAWRVDGDASVELARINASCRGWLAAFVRGPSITGWKPQGPLNAEQFKAKGILEALDVVASRNAAPAVSLAEQIIEAERELFRKIVGLDFAIGANASAEDFAKFKGGTRDPFAIADKWPFRYAASTATLNFTSPLPADFTKAGPK